RVGVAQQHRAPAAREPRAHRSADRAGADDHVVAQARAASIVRREVSCIQDPTGLPPASEGAHVTVRTRLLSLAILVAVAALCATAALRSPRPAPKRGRSATRACTP